jgi:hypothetical protein
MQEFLFAAADSGGQCLLTARLPKIILIPSSYAVIHVTAPCEKLSTAGTTIAMVASMRREFLGGSFFNGPILLVAITYAPY